MSVAGTYDIAVQTPIGAQRGQLTVTPDGGDSFSGVLAGDLGAQQIDGGAIAGDTITWRMEISKPMPMKLDCEATIAGDSLTGKVKAGVFGSFPLTGTRTA